MADPVANLLRRREVPKYLKDKHGQDISEAYLTKLACVGGGPPFRLAGRFPLYDKVGLDEWATARLSPRVRSTSELRLAS